MDGDMDNGVRVIALGELLVDFAQAGLSEGGAALFERNAGGAPANVACALARLDVATAFVGCVGNDLHGDFLGATLATRGVDVSGLVRTGRAFTTLSFVQIDPATGERTFSFARRPGADTLLAPADLDLEAIRAADVLHVGSLSLTDEPSRSAARAAVEAARAAGTLVSFDVNWRASLWPSETAGRAAALGMVGRAALVKANLDEARMLTGRDEPAAAAGELLERGSGLVAVTMGAQGAFLATPHASAQVAALPARAVDTTGAGDAFWGACLAWLLARADGCGLPLAAAVDALDADALAACGRFACAAASISVERRGGIPSLPSLAEVRERLSRSTEARPQARR